MRAFRHDGHQPLTHPSRSALRTNVVERHRRSREQTAPAAPADRAFGRRPGSGPHRETPGAAGRIDDGLHPCFLALLRRQHEGTDQRRMRAARRRVGARHRARPQPGDDRRLRAVRQPRPGVEMADPPLRLVAHPAPVMAHVFGEPLRAPGAVPDRAVGEPGAGLRVDRGEAGEARRDLDQRPGDQHRDRVEVRTMGAQAQPLRLQRDRAAAAERIDHRRRMFGEKGVDLRPRPRL